MPAPSILCRSTPRWEQTKHGRVREAQERFFVTSGHGLGLRFFDTKAGAPEVSNLTLYNVVWWVNKELPEGEELLTPQEAQFKHWHPVAPRVRGRWIERHSGARRIQSETLVRRL